MFSNYLHDFSHSFLFLGKKKNPNKPPEIGEGL
jgi:hypothetical protein